jgi:hypothetical protein
LLNCEPIEPGCFVFAGATEFESPFSSQSVHVLLPIFGQSIQFLINFPAAYLLLKISVSGSSVALVSNELFASLSDFSYRWQKVLLSRNACEWICDLANNVRRIASKRCSNRGNVSVGIGSVTFSVAA